MLFLVGLFIDPIAKRLLEKQVSNVAEGQYSLALEDLDISILAGSVSLTGIRFTTDTVVADSTPYAFMRANKVAIEGVSWLTYLLDQRLQTDRIYLDSPDIELITRTVTQQQDTTQQGGPFKLEQLDIYPAIKKQVDRVLLEDLALNDLSLTVVNETTQDTLLLNAGELNFKSDNVLVDAHTFFTDERAFYATRINFQGKDLLVTRTGNNNLRGAAGELQFITKEEYMSVLGDNLLFFQDTLPQFDTTLFVGLQEFALEELNLNKIQEESVAPINKISLTGLKVVNNMPPASKTSSSPDTASSQSFNISELSLGQSLPEFIDRVELKELDINQVFVRQGDSIKVEDFNLHANQIVIGNQAAFAENRFLHAASMESRTEQIKVSMGDPIQNLVLNGLSIDFDNGTGTIGFKELEVNPSVTTDKTMWYEATVGPVKVVGINTTEILDRKLSIDSIGILDPVVLVNMQESPKEQKSQSSTAQQGNKELPSLYPAIEGFLDQLRLRKLAVIEGDVRIADVGSSDYGVVIPAFYLQLSDVLIAEGTAFEGDRVLHAADIAVRMENISYPMPDSVYSIELGLFRLSTYEQFLEADNFRLTYSDDYEEFLKGPETNQIYSITNEDFRMDGIQFQQMIQNKGIFIESVKSDGLEVYVYKNANYPAKTSTKGNSTGMPQKMLNQIGMPLYVGSFELSSGHFIYETLPSEADTAGVLEVTDLFFLANNVTNVPRRLKVDPEIFLKAGGMLMGSGAFQTEMLINMLNDSSLVQITGKVDTLDLTKLNRFAIYTTPVAISSGTLYEMDWNIKADEKNATGTLLMSYEDLKIQVSSPSSSDTTGIFKDIGSFLVNTLALEEDVPAEDPKEPEKAKISHERDKDKSFVDYYISALMDGLKDIVITIF